MKTLIRLVALCAALFVCTLIATLFLESFVRVDITIVVAGVFVITMLLLIVGLICFLREIFIGTHTLRIGPH